MAGKRKAEKCLRSNVNNAQPTEDQQSSEPEDKRIRVEVIGIDQGSQSQPYFESSSGGTEHVEDWSQNIVVIESIFNHLSFTDLKSARFVCKLWAFAGAVPLSQKSVIARDRGGFSLPEIEEYLNVFQRNPALKTGFRFRHVHLVWGQQRGFSTAETEALLRSWLAIFRSEEFQLLVSLKIVGCPVEVISKILLPKFLPKYWKKLKSLVFNKSSRKATGLVLDSEDTHFPDLKLEEFGLDVDSHPRAEYNWEFLKRCSKLKAFKMVATDCKDFDPDNHNMAAEIKRQRSTFNSILTALKGKELTSLNFRFNPKLMAEDELLPMTAEMKSFLERLLLMNQRTLEDLDVSVEILPAVVQQLFQNLPLAPQLQRLKSFKIKCNCINFEMLTNIRRLSTFYEALSVFQAKGYLGVENFCLNVVELTPQLHQADILTKISFASENSTRLAIKYEGEMNDIDIHLPQGFEDMMTESFPNINYVCMPKQFYQLGSSEETVDTTTALFEKLGRDSVFNLLFGYAMWKSLVTLKVPEDEAHRKRWNMCFQDKVGQLRDHEPITSNALANVKLDWTDFEEKNRGTLFVFDTVPDLEEAWAKVITSNCCWSTVGENDLAPDEQMSAVFCRMYEVGCG